MKKHVKVYLKENGYDVCDIILCEYGCGIAVDIHHIKYKSQGGEDVNENLIALCRAKHDDAHEGRIDKEELFEMARRRIDANTGD